MSSDKFDNFILWNIIKNSKYDPYGTLDRLEEYIRGFPIDIVAYKCYINVLIDIGQFEEAKEILNFVELSFPDKIDEKIIYSKFRLLSFTEKYEEAYEIYKKYKNKLITIEPRIEFFEVVYDLYNNKELRRNGFSTNSYLYNQIIEYKKEDFIDHIKKHLADYNMNLEEPNPALFNSDFPLDDVIEELDKLIPNEKKTYFGFCNNFYVFKYDNAGRVSNKSVDYFRVVVLNNTNRFITMYPMQHGELLPYIDLNYLNKNYSNPKVKRLSRVDMFYNKYGNQLNNKK